MALSRLKAWVAEILFASDLNAEFNNIYSNGESLGWPATSLKDLQGNELVLDDDGDTSIQADADDRIDFRVGTVDIVRFDGTTASVENGFDFVGTVAADPVRVLVTGTDDRGISFDAVNDEQMLILNATTAAVNEIAISSAATNTNPTIASSGGDTDIGIDFENDQAEEMLILEPVATGINELTIKNAASGGRPIIAATGTDADNGIEFHNDQSEEILILQSAATSVSEVTITSAATGTGGPTIATTTSETNVGLNIDATGSGDVKIGKAGTGLTLLGDALIAFPATDGSAGNHILVTDGSAVGSFASNVIGSGTATNTVIPLPRSYLAGLAITINPDADNADEISVAVGCARNSADDTNLVLAAALKKTLDETWTAGAGGGMNDNDAIGASEWFHVFLVSNPTGSTVDVGFDVNVDASDLMADTAIIAAGITKFRRIGSVRTDTGPDIFVFKQEGDYFYWDVPKLSETVATQDFVAGVDITIDFVPPDVIVEHNGAMEVDVLDIADVMLLQPDGITGVAPAEATMPGQLAGAGNDSVFRPLVMLVDSQKILVKVEAAGDQSSSLFVTTIYYRDRRGRDD